MDSDVNMRLTERQQAVLEFIADAIRASGSSPTVREIAAHFRMASPKGVTDHLSALERKGYLVRTPGRARNIQLTHAPDAIPIVGEVAAGTPITAIENVTGSVNWNDLFSRPGIFAVRVRGDSMRDAGIMSGDLVLVQKDARVENGAIGVAYLDGEATVKRVYRTATGVRLDPENPAYQPLHVEASSTTFALAGPVIGVVRHVAH